MRFCAVGLLLVVVASGYGQDFSPIPVRNYRPYSTLFLRFEPSSGPLANRRSEWTISGVGANSLNFYPNRLVAVLAEEDIEDDRIDFRYARGLTHGWGVSAEGTIEAFGPGFLDPVISWYHRTFLRLHSLRQFVPYGGHLVFSPAGGKFRGGFGFGDLTLIASKSVGAGTFLSGAIKLPTGNPGELLGSGAVDIGVYAQTTRRLGRQIGVTVDAGLIGQGAAKRLAHTRSLAWQGGATFAYVPNRRDTWLVQVGYEESPLVEGIEALDKVEPSTTFGYRRRLSARQSLEAYFSEDINPFNSNFPIGADVGPDFVVGIAWRLRL